MFKKSLNLLTGGLLLPQLLLFLLLTSPFLLVAEVFANTYWLLQQSFLLVLLLVAATFFQRGTKTTFPPLIGYFLIGFAIFIYLQSLFIPPLFKGQLYAVVAVFIVASLLAYAVRHWVLNWGQDSLLLTLAWGLLIGTILQSLVVIFQFFSLDDVFTWVAPADDYSPTGQMMQRNQLGHYLMWGIIAWVYLWHKKVVRSSLALILMIVLTAVLGLVGSRTIIAYVIALFVLLGIWWLLNQQKCSQLIRLFCVTLLLILLWQFLMPKLSVAFGFYYQSGADRLLGGESNIGRFSEWEKAWLLFLQSPWFGHGWGSYTSESFLLQLDNFKNYELNKIAAHCHNILLQLLAEVGMLGAFVPIAAIVSSIVIFFKKKHENYLFLLAFLAITMTHSLLEYPLWLPYFLFPFIIFLSATLSVEAFELPKRTARLLRFCLILIVVLIGARFFLINHSYLPIWYLSHFHLEETPKAKQSNAMVLYDLGKVEVFLDYEAALGLIYKITADDEDLSPVFAEAASRAIHYRPYVHIAFERGLYLYRQGKFDEADEWIAATVRHYPQNLPAYVEGTVNSVHFQALAQPLYEACEVYRRINPEIGSCVPGEAEVESN